MSMILFVPKTCGRCGTCSAHDVLKPHGLKPAPSMMTHGMLLGGSYHKERLTNLLDWLRMFSLKVHLRMFGLCDSSISVILTNNNYGQNTGAVLDLLFKLHNPHRCHPSVNTIPLPKCGFRQGFAITCSSLKKVVKSIVTWGSGRYIHEAPWFEHCSPGQKSRSRTAGRHNGVLPKLDLEKGERTCTLEVNIYQHGLPQNYP